MKKLKTILLLTSSIAWLSGCCCEETCGSSCSSSYYAPYSSGCCGSGW